MVNFEVYSESEVVQVPYIFMVRKQRHKKVDNMLNNVSEKKRKRKHNVYSNYNMQTSVPTDRHNGPGLPLAEGESFSLITKLQSPSYSLFSRDW